jgi:hypothetical protein
MQKRAAILLAAVVTIVNYTAFTWLYRPHPPTWVYVPDSNPRCPNATTTKHKTDVVMFVPSPMQWWARRRPVVRQFLRERWTSDQVVLIFVFGTREGPRLEQELDTSHAEMLPGAKYIFTGCRDLGDAPNNPNGTSSTTCKVYEACVHIAQHYDAKYVWRGADDSYVNLQLFFRLMPLLPSTRLYLGRYRDASRPDSEDLQLVNHQPMIQPLFGLYQFGGYMSGMGFLFSYDVAEFIGTLSIPPHQTWCEDVMVGMWLNPFRITKMDFSATPGFKSNPPLVVHYMKREWWYAIRDDGALIVDE